jgi:hypothetical protein
VNNLLRYCGGEIFTTVEMLVNILTYYYRCTLHSTLNPFFLDSFIFWGSSTGGLLIIILGRGFVKIGGAWILKEW